MYDSLNYISSNEGKREGEEGGRGATWIKEYEMVDRKH